MSRLWTNEEDNYLRANYDLTDEILGEHLKRSSRAVYERRMHLLLPSQRGADGVRAPIAMSRDEKVMRIRKLACDMRVRLMV